MSEHNHPTTGMPPGWTWGSPPDFAPTDVDRWGLTDAEAGARKALIEAGYPEMADLITPVKETTMTDPLEELRQRYAAELIERVTAQVGTDPRIPELGWVDGQPQRWDDEAKRWHAPLDEDERLRYDSILADHLPKPPREPIVENGVTWQDGHVSDYGDVLEASVGVFTVAVDESGRRIVYLPHSCDEWVVAGGDRDLAREALVDFIAEAEQALTLLDASPNIKEV